MSTGQEAAVSLVLSPSNGKTTRRSSSSLRMVMDKWYWAPRAEDLHNPITAQGPFDSEMEATEKAYREVAQNPQLMLPGVPVRHHFFTGRIALSSIAIPDLDLEYFLDDVRTLNSPKDMDDDDWDNWLFDVSPETVEHLNESFKCEFQRWIKDNGLYPPVCGVEDLNHHEV